MDGKHWQSGGTWIDHRKFKIVWRRNTQKRGPILLFSENVRL